MSVFVAWSNAQRALKALSVAEGVIEMSEERHTLVEEIELEGRQMLDRIRELIQEGNVRRLIIRDGNGKFVLEVPLTVGVVAGGVFALSTPVWAALGTLAALVARVKIEVVREVDADDEAAEDSAGDESGG
jgi:hypothetical protein